MKKSLDHLGFVFIWKKPKNLFSHTHQLLAFSRHG